MAFDEGVAQRLREALSAHVAITEKRMFGGLAFLLDGNMCCGVVGEELMVRVGPERYEQALQKPHARKMDFTGRPLSGFVYVAPPGFETDGDLQAWVRQSIAFVGGLPPK